MKKLNKTQKRIMGFLHRGYSYTVKTFSREHKEMIKLYINTNLILIKIVDGKSREIFLNM